MCRACAEDGVKSKGQKVLILGAGGVARAVAVVLLDEGQEAIIHYGGKGTEHSGAEVDPPHRKKTEITKALSIDAYKCYTTGREHYVAIQAARCRYVSGL